MIPVVKFDYKLKGGTWFFYKKRAIRIIPTLYITIGFCLLLIWLFIGNKTGTHWDMTLPVSKRSVLTALLIVQDCFKITAGKINHVFWSVFVETRIYILFPLLIFLYKKVGPLLLLFFVIIISAVIPTVIKFANSINNIWVEETPGVSPMIILFVLGMIACDICLSTEKFYKIRIKLRWTIILLLMTLVILLARKLMYLNIINSQILDVVVGFWTMCLLVVCYKETFYYDKNRIITKILTWKPLVFVGTFAYSLYLTHAPLLQIITQYIIFPMHLTRFASAWFILIISLPICVGFAYLFFLLFEKPFITMGKKVTIKNVETLAAINPAI